MSENQRASFRVTDGFEAELVRHGRAERCDVLDLSAGGARIVSTGALEPGTQVGLRVRLAGDHSAGPGLVMSVEVLDTIPDDRSSDGTAVRLRHLAPEGSTEHEAVARLVTEAQRRLRSRETGVGQASPMRTVPEERQARRAKRGLRLRFSKGGD